MITDIYDMGHLSLQHPKSLLDKPTCGQTNRRLVNSRTSQLANGEFWQITKKLHNIWWLITLALNLIEY